MNLAVFKIWSLIPNQFIYIALFSDAIPYFPVSKSEFNEVENRFTTRLVDAFAAFVKTARPATAEQPWPPVGENGELQPDFLRVGEVVEVERDSGVFPPIAKVWHEVYATGYGRE